MTTSHEFFRRQSVVEWYGHRPASFRFAVSGMAPDLWYQARGLYVWRCWDPWYKSWGEWFADEFAIPDVPVRVIPASLADEDPDTR